MHIEPVPVHDTAGAARMIAGRADGWSAASLIEQGLPAMSSRFSRLVSIEEIFPHDPL